MDFDTYVQLAETYNAVQPNLRVGQAYMNLLAMLTPFGYLANEVPDYLDPFYIDERLPAFLTWLEERM